MLQRAGSDGGEQCVSSEWMRSGEDERAEKKKSIHRSRSLCFPSMGRPHPRRLRAASNQRSDFVRATDDRLRGTRGGATQALSANLRNPIAEAPFAVESGRTAARRAPPNAPNSMMRARNRSARWIDPCVGPPPIHVAQACERAVEPRTPQLLRWVVEQPKPHKGIFCSYPLFPPRTPLFVRSDAPAIYRVGAARPSPFSAAVGVDRNWARGALGRVMWVALGRQNNVGPPVRLPPRAFFVASLRPLLAAWGIHKCQPASPQPTPDHCRRSSSGPSCSRLAGCRLLLPNHRTISPQARAP